MEPIQGATGYAESAAKTQRRLMPFIMENELNCLTRTGD